MRKTRLFWQIYPAILLTTLASVVILGWYVAENGRSFYLEQLQAGIRSRALLIEPIIDRLATQEDQALHSYVRQSGRRAGTRITLVDNQGTVLADSDENYLEMDNHAQRPELKKALAGETGSAIRFSATLGQSMLYVAIPTRLANGKIAALRLSVPATVYEDILRSMQLKFGLFAVAIMALAALLAVYSARRISRPLEIMRQGAVQLTKGRIDQLSRISSDRMSTEMAGLADTLNTMAEEINRRVKIIIQQRNELEGVFSGMADGVVAIDRDQKILRMNQAATTLFSLSPEAVQGKSVQGVIRNPQLLGLISQALQDHLPLEEEVILFDGTTPLILQTHIVPLGDAGQPMGILVILHDLTKLNRLENIRQDFVANVSHELKTPITAIKGYVETLLDGALDNRDDAQRFLGIVSRQTSRLESIIEDLLALSRLENKEESGEIERTLLAVGPVLEAAAQTCAVQAEEKGITVRIDSDERLTAPINQALLEQAMINLLQNGIAYSPPQSVITLRAAGKEEMAGGSQVLLSVIDQGGGISREHLPRLFERFYRCDKGRNRESGGTGLGLAIVKHIARAHHGRVEVVSSPEQGSTFTITLPATPGQEV
ncbi:ATP-binding protein [Desulfogranum mediterraneum]|uniref:ATP-binding protein n=1 Tax=Desulfogranum mediterraneum TaxID=160661 RepID=UPI00041A3FA3|nr:ATP-binding protein [Desulfogranum mediterraneum]